MTKIHVEVNGEELSYKRSGDLTKGMTCAAVTFSFGSDWDDLHAIAVFRAGDVVVEEPMVNSHEVMVPYCVMEQVGQQLEIAVEGRNLEKGIILPTKWIQVGKIHESAHIQRETPDSLQPERIDQIMSAMGDLFQLDTQDKSSLVAAINEVMAQSGGSGGSSGGVFLAKYGQTTYEEIAAAYSKKAACFAILGGSHGFMQMFSIDATKAVFYAATDFAIFKSECSNDSVWSYNMTPLTGSSDVSESSDVFMVIPGTTTFPEITEAHDAGKLCVAIEATPEQSYTMSLVYKGEDVAYFASYGCGGTYNVLRGFRTLFVTNTDEGTRYEHKFISYDVASEITDDMGSWDIVPDYLIPTVDAVRNYFAYALAQAKESGEIGGEDGYTPVRGVDFWTEEDKAEIKTYVDEAIEVNGSSDAFTVIAGTTTFPEITEAHDAGRMCVAVEAMAEQSYTMPLVYKGDNVAFFASYGCGGTYNVMRGFHTLSVANTSEGTQSEYKFISYDVVSEITDDTGLWDIVPDYLIPNVDAVRDYFAYALEKAKESGEIGGADGYTPVRGVDYWTAEDRAQMEADSEAFILAELAKRGQLKPEFVNSVEECTDSTKLYVLPDGYIYAYMRKKEEVVIPGKTLTTPAKAAIVKGMRYSHSGQAFVAADNAAALVIPVDAASDIAQSAPVVMSLTNMSGHATYTGVSYGTENDAFPNGGAKNSLYAGFADYEVYGILAGKWFLTIALQYTGTDGEYDGASVIFDGVTIDAEVYPDSAYASHAVATITESTTETVETEGYFNTGHAFAPADYEDRIVELEAKAKTIDENTNRILELENTMQTIPANGNHKCKSITIGSSTQPLESSVTMFVPQLKKNKTIAFSGTYTGNLTEISIVQGEGTGFTEAKCIVTATTISITKNGAEVYTAKHGLTFGSHFSLVLVTKNLNKTTAYLTSGGVVFTSAEFVWNSSRRELKLYTNVPFTQYQFSFGSSDFDKKVWMYGDSYFDHWLPLSIGRGYTNCLVDGFSGETSAAGASSFRLAMEHGTPSKVVWCLGMNNGDNGSVNQSWLNSITSVKEICDEHGIELWVTTIPNVPNIDHSYKNAYIRDNFENYVDISKYVGAEESTGWYPGLLSSDNVHPSAEGDFYLANIIETCFPEILNT